MTRRSKVYDILKLISSAPFRAGVMVLFLFSNVLPCAFADETHCKVWRGSTLCRISPPKTSSSTPVAGGDVTITTNKSGDVFIKGNKIVFGSQTGLSVNDLTANSAKKAIELRGQAAVAIEDLQAKEIRGVLLLSLSPDPEEDKEPRTRLPSGGFRHYFQGVRNSQPGTFVCTDIGVDLSHVAGSHDNYQAEPLGKFELKIGQGQDPLIGSFQAEALINSKTPTVYSTSLNLDHLPISHTSDQETWDSLFKDPLPQLKTISTHTLIKPMGDGVVHFK